MAGRPSKGERTALLVRLEPRVLDGVKALAEQDMRSVNAEIEVLLREALARRGKRIPPPESDG